MHLERLQKIHSKSKAGGSASQNVCAGPPLGSSLSCEWLFPSEKNILFCYQQSVIFVLHGRDNE